MKCIVIGRINATYDQVQEGSLEQWLRSTQVDPSYRNTSQATTAVRQQLEKTGMFRETKNNIGVKVLCLR